MSDLGEWDSFYAIVGSAAGTLIGLQFVVMTLIAQRPQLPAAEVGHAFSTPTIVHFSTVLFLSAVLRAPWHSVIAIATLWDFVGFSGLAYGLIVARRMKAQTAYVPDSEDWLFHALLPPVAYAALALSALAVSLHAREALFGVGAAALLLLFTGIHNAWDAVTYQVLANNRSKPPL